MYDDEDDEPKSKKSKKQTDACVLRFAAMPPTENVLEIDQAFFLSHFYSNQLRDVERKRRTATLEVLKELDPVYVALDEELTRINARIEEIRSAIKRSKAAAHQGIPFDEEIPLDELKALQAERKPIYADHKARKKLLFGQSAFADALTKALGSLKKDATHACAAVSELLDSPPTPELRPLARSHSLIPPLRKAMAALQAAKKGQVDSAKATVRDAANRINVAESTRPDVAGPLLEVDRRFAEQARLRRQEIKMSSQKLQELAAKQLQRAGAADEETIRLDRVAKVRRGKLGLYFGSYLLVEAAAKQFRKGAPPRFRRYQGGGRLGVSITPGIPLEKLFSDDTRVQIADGPGKVYKHQLRLRIGSDRARRPIWATVPIRLHREIRNPAALGRLAGGLVKGVTLIRKRLPLHAHWAQPVGQLHDDPRSYSWEVQIVVVFPHGRARKFVHVGPGKACGIDIGFRRCAGGVRVAYVVGDDDEVATPMGEFVLEQAFFSGLDKCRDLQSLRKTAFNDARDRLTEWLKPRRDGGVPSWLDQATKELHAWKSPDRLARFVQEWKRKRFEGDAEIFTFLDGAWVRAAEGWRQRREKAGHYEGWGRQDAHLAHYERNYRSRLLRRRLHIYRNFAAAVARRYAIAYMEDIDLRDLQRRPVAEAEESLLPLAARYRTWTSLSELRECLLESGLDVRQRQPENTTKMCHVCGKLCVWDQAAELVHACEHCIAVWDQDYNAGHNLLTGQSEIE